MQFQFNSLQEFIAMGGHGPYVWAAYGVGLAVLLWLVLRPVVQKRRFLKQLLINQQRIDNNTSRGAN